MCSRTEFRQNYVKTKVFEDKLCQSRHVKSRKVQVKICPTKVGEAHFWCRHIDCSQFTPRQAVNYWPQRHAWRHFRFHSYFSGCERSTTQFFIEILEDWQYWRLKKNVCNCKVISILNFLYHLIPAVYCSRGNKLHRSGEDLWVNTVLIHVSILRHDGSIDQYFWPRYIFIFYKRKFRQF